MKKHITFCLRLLVVFAVTSAVIFSVSAAAIGIDAKKKRSSLKAESPEQITKRLQWWSNARFGMFIHWGLYAQWGCHYPGTNGELINGGSAHMMQRLKIPLAQYAKIADVFDPTNFNADEWVSIAKNAGMKYMIFTSKHHDGFAMFNSPSSDYNIVKRTPWHRDPVKELAAACRKQGIKFGVYYSLGRDWSDPD
ncbi:MAG: alpha-L-fucosidase, partial [Limisphaerales bacterium]